MAFRFANLDRVKEETTTTGTGTLTISGAVSGFRAFSAVCSTGDLVVYAVADSSGNWERGIGFYSSGTLTRSRVLRSSNSNALVNFSAGTKRVYCPTDTIFSQSSFLQWFGDASDGDVTVSTAVGPYTRDMYFSVLTAASGGSIDWGGFRIFAHVLDLRGAPAGFIRRALGDGGNGANPTAGSAGANFGGTTVGGSAASTAGGAGGTAAGSASSGNGSSASPGNGGAGGSNGGTAGSGSGGAGGAPQRFGGSVGSALPIRRPAFDLIRGSGGNLLGGAGGAGGAGGGGDGTAGGGGGGGGGGGPVLGLWAGIVIVDGTTTASCVAAPGGRGGNGSTPAGGNRGGGGGGSGGGGGWVYHVRGATIGTASNVYDASGGRGGDGGTGTGTGTNGTGAQGGSGGRITIVDLSSGTVSETFGTTGTNFSGTTGGNGNSVLVSI